MKDDYQQAWEEFLDPNILRQRLISASLFIAVYEGLKDAIIERIQEFFYEGYEDGKRTVSPKYESEVCGRNRSRLYASLDWLKEMDAVDASDLNAFDRIKKCRNTLAHGLLKMISQANSPPDFNDSFEEMIALYRKIEVWWIVNAEIPCNPELDGTEIAESEISPGTLLTIGIMRSLALGL